MESGTLERIGRVRSDYDPSFVPGWHYSKRYCRCRNVLSDEQLPVIVRCMTADLVKLNSFGRARNYWWDVTNAQWQAIRWWVFLLDTQTCVYCGDRADTIDHIIPVSRGGSFHPENCVSACTRCNSSKGAKTPNEWGGRRE